jgi:3-oxocholest-4-en-26-oate---CoA ligase
MEFNLADLFESVVDAIPERVALVCGDRRLTFRDVEQRSNKIGRHLAGAGVKPGEHVGLYLHNSTEYVETMIGCLKIRAVPVNVNFRYVADELRYLFDDADLVAVVHEASFAEHIAKIRDEIPMLRHLISVNGESEGSVTFEDATKGVSAARDFEPRSPDDLFIIYTGGTTGMPKGVMWRQEDLFFTGMGGGNPTGTPIEKPEQLAIGATQRDPQIVQFAVPPLIHGAAQLGVFIGFFWGDKVVLVPRFEPEAVWAAVEREGVNTITVVGDAMARPLAETLAANPQRWDTSTLVYFGSAGAVLSDAVKDLLRSLLPNTYVTENFGSTEAGHQGMEAPGGTKPEGGGLRFLMKDTTTVLDDDLNQIEPGSGRIGRLALRGRVPLGYYKDPEKTRSTFAELNGQRWVMPGDLATIDADGSVIVFGRGSMCINTGGEKVFPEEVEAVVKGHPDVWDTVIVGVKDERWGERVVAIVQPRSGKAPTLEDIDKHCRGHLAGYKVPRELWLVDEIVRSPSGKPDYRWAKAVAAGEPVEA